MNAEIAAGLSAAFRAVSGSRAVEADEKMAALVFLGACGRLLNGDAHFRTRLAEIRHSVLVEEAAKGDREHGRVGVVPPPPEAA
jgi:hypothetical protein